MLYREKIHLVARVGNRTLPEPIRGQRNYQLQTAFHAGLHGPMINGHWNKLDLPRSDQVWENSLTSSASPWLPCCSRTGRIGGSAAFSCKLSGSELPPEVNRAEERGQTEVETTSSSSSSSTRESLYLKNALLFLFFDYLHKATHSKAVVFRD